MTDARVTVQEQQGWSAFTAGPVHVLVAWDGRHPALARLRAAAGGGLDDVLDALAREGVRTAPDFVAVEECSPLRVVSRGRAYAVVSAPEGDLEFRSAGRGPWADEDAPEGTTAVVLHTGHAPAVVEPAPEPPQPAQSSRPALGSQPALESQPGGGWRLPSRLGRGAPPGLVPPAPAPAQDDVEDLPSYDHLFGATQRGRPETGAAQYIEAHDTDSISEPGIGQAPVAAAGGFSPGAGQRSDQTLPPPGETDRNRTRTTPVDGAATRAPAAQQSAPAPAAKPPPTAAQPSPTAPQPPAAAPQPRAAAATSAAPPVAPLAGGLIDSVPWRSGGSNVAPPEEPLPPRGREEIPDAALPHPFPVPSTAPSPVPSTAPSPVPPPPPAATPPTAWQVPPAETPAATPSVATAGDLDGDTEATVDRSALRAAAQADSGPLVPAVLCPAGHPSPPHAGTCRACGRDIPPQQPYQTPRPPLGVLRLGTGDVVALDRGVLLGRSPKGNADLPAGDRPHLVRVPSPENDISRNHVEVVLEGWHVLVRDLGSTNGTTVALPGAAPVRLRPGDQQVIEPGTIVTMADEVSFTFEVGQ